jgi:glycosyltransferase involved in cell wall biosynthesis
MMPGPYAPGKNVGGIQTVIGAYSRILPDYDIELVHPNAESDILVRHAGMGGGPCDVAMLHGIYFTSDYRASKYEWLANKHVVSSIRRARIVTVPSEWVAETIRRDFRIDPIILPHGIFPDDWAHNYAYTPKTVLWAKNRFYDVCDPTPLNDVAARMPDYKFFSTIAAPDAPTNVVEIGVQQPADIKQWIQRVEMVISTVKETWGIMYAEALAAGTPVVASGMGHVPNLVEHGVTGYIYEPGHPDDVVYGISWVNAHRKQLSANASQQASKLSWELAGKRVARTLWLAYEMRKHDKSI